MIVQVDHLEAKNAPNTKVCKQLAKIFSELALNDNIRVVILNGGESVFAAGTDLKELSSAQTAKMYLRHIEHYWQAITHYPKSVIAAVNGYAVSGG